MNKDYGQLDEKGLIFRQIDRTNRLITEGLENQTADNWKLLTERFGLAVRNLESLLTPLIDEKYKERKEKLKEEHNKEVEESDNSQNIFSKKEYYSALQSELIQLLYRNSVYFGESNSFVIDKTKEDEDEAVVVD